MKLKDLLFNTSRDSILNLYVNGKYVLKGEAYYFFQNWEDDENNNFNSYVEPYIHEEVNTIEWTEECLLIFIDTETYEE